MFFRLPGLLSIAAVGQPAVARPPTVIHPALAGIGYLSTDSCPVSCMPSQEASCCPQQPHAFFFLLRPPRLLCPSYEYRTDDAGRTKKHGRYQYIIPNDKEFVLLLTPDEKSEVRF